MKKIKKNAASIAAGLTLGAMAVTAHAAGYRYSNVFNFHLFDRGGHTFSGYAEKNKAREYWRILSLRTSVLSRSKLTNRRDAFFPYARRKFADVLYVPQVFSTKRTGKRASGYVNFERDSTLGQNAQALFEDLRSGQTILSTHLDRCNRGFPKACVP